MRIYRLHCDPGPPCVAQAWTRICAAGGPLVGLRAPLASLRFAPAAVAEHLRRPAPGGRPRLRSPVCEPFARFRRSSAVTDGGREVTATACVGARAARPP